ncbi:MAG: hypothetical protein ACOCRO_02950 [Halanaerobiales bacterium]
MESIKTKKLVYFIMFISGFVLGVIIGISSLTALISYRIDEYYQTIKKLESDIEDKSTRLVKLEEKLNEAQEESKFILKEVQVFLDTTEDEIDKIALTKHIKEKYTSLIGKEVATIDMEIVNEIIDNRIFRLESDEYQLKVEKIFLSDILMVWVKVEAIDESE